MCKYNKKWHIQYRLCLILDFCYVYWERKYTFSQFSVRFLTCHDHFLHPFIIKVCRLFFLQTTLSSCSLWKNLDNYSNKILMCNLALMMVISTNLYTKFSKHFEKMIRKFGMTEINSIISRKNISVYIIFCH